MLLISVCFSHVLQICFSFHYFPIFQSEEFFRSTFKCIYAAAGKKNLQPFLIFFLFIPSINAKQMYGPSVIPMVLVPFFFRAILQD